MNRTNSRREFLKGAAYTGIGILIADRSLAAGFQTPNEKINFACIGVGGKGDSDTADAARFGNVVAICDVDETTLNAAAVKYPGAKKYSDYRIMLDEMERQIDAVTVSTPDHTHAVSAAMAMEMGKHCFCQKPLTHSIWEARRLGEIARKRRVVTQMGNQGTASSALRQSAAMIRAGAVGAVNELHVWTNRPIWPQGGPRNPAKPVPPTLNWDMWLGPAPFREYADGYHTFAWRGWWDFGTGALGDMACHTLNMPYMALDLRNPTSVQAQTSGHNRDSFPQWSIIRYEFPRLGKRPALSMTWYDGGKLPSAELLDGETPSSSGYLIIGDKGKFYSGGDYGAQGKFFGGTPMPDVTFQASPGHFEEFARGIKGEMEPVSNFPNYAGPLTETVLLGNLAVWADGKKIEWDARRLRAKNAPEVAEIIRPKYRPGYKV